jgi:AAA ATPase domain
VASQWCFVEVCLARSLGHPVFPVRLEPGIRLPLLADVQWVDVDNGAVWTERLLGGLRSAGLGADDSFAWDPQRSPYPGLVPFRAEDAAVFFGRERETDRLMELLAPTLLRGRGRFVGVIGPSGSGKSSLVHAGLLPRLARMRSRWTLVPPVRPGRRPMANLATSLHRAFDALGSPRPFDAITESLSESGAPALVELAHELAALDGDGMGASQVLVVVDQAEELMTQAGAHE